MTLPASTSIANLMTLLQQQADLDLTAIEMAEILWLSLNMGAGTSPTATPQVEERTESGVVTVEELPPRRESQPLDQQLIPIVASPPQPKTETGTGVAYPITIPAATALRQRLELGRALRPLMQKVPSRVFQTVDETATANQFAETKSWSPVVQPAPERWLELAIVVEETSILAVWQETITEMQQLLERHGAFRAVRLWRLIERSGKLQLFLGTAAGSHSRPRRLKELDDPSGRRLILLVSDCTSKSWQSSLPKLLQTWARQNPVTVLQLLPEHYWDRTALGAGYPVGLRALTAGGLTGCFQLEGLSRRRRQTLRDQPQKGLTLPIVTLEPEPLQRWAEAIAAVGNQLTAGVVFDLELLQAHSQAKAAQTALTPLQRVRQFRGTASPLARRLAGMMASVPVNWSVIRLIQKNLLPDSGALHLAEIFLSGLVEQLPAEDDSKLSSPRYEFVAGVRELLRSEMPISVTEEVMEEVADDFFNRLSEEIRERVSQDIERRWGTSLRSFEAWLLPDLPWGEVAAAEMLPFAQVTREALAQLGEEQAELIQALEQTPSAPMIQEVSNIASLLSSSEQQQPLQSQIREAFLHQEHEFELTRQLRQNPIERIDRISITSDYPITVSIDPFAVEQAEHQRFSLPVQIEFSIAATYAREVGIDLDDPTEDALVFDLDDYIIPNRSTEAIAEIELSVRTNAVAVRLIHLQVQQPIRIDDAERRWLPIPDSPDFPNLEEFEFETVLIEIEETELTIGPATAHALGLPEVEGTGLEPFGFEMATVEIQRQGRRQPKVVIQKERRQALGYLEPLSEDINLEMVAIPEGTFLMGSPENEPERYENESPQHEVTVSAFFMGKYPVTQAQWRAVAALPRVERKLKPDPSRFKGGDRPVEQVSWLDVVEFCARLSQLTGKEYRLPTEAEWEYACRAGTATPFNFGEAITPDLANYIWDRTYNNIKVTKKKDFEGTTPVGQFAVANAFGLYDMYGNIWEWCEDHWHNNYKGAPTDESAWLNSNADEDASRVLRGGSWINNPRNCRSATRGSNDAGLRDDSFGFRVVCSAQTENQSVQVVQPSLDDLSSERGIDYTKLQELLAVGRWQESDEETWNIMLQMTGCEEQKHLYSSALSQIPGDDLRTIDRLWVKYSNGRFGFSVQKKIWYEVSQNWQRFIKQVGWEKSNNMKSYDELTFSLNAPVGHLPFQFGTPDSCWVGSRCGGYGSEMNSLLSRPEL